MKPDTRSREVPFRLPYVFAGNSPRLASAMDSITQYLVKHSKERSLCVKAHFQVAEEG